MFSSLLLIFVFYASNVQNVYSWGLVGHSLVAQLAHSQLTNEASAWIKTLVPPYSSGNFTGVATWADNILYADTNPSSYQSWQWSRSLHYVNTPYWKCNYDQVRDCKNDNCIEGALRNYSQRAVDPNLHGTQHQEAVLFLIHYIGDIHQPLHAGFQSDLGGNSVKGWLPF